MFSLPNVQFPSRNRPVRQRQHHQRLQERRLPPDGGHLCGGQRPGRQAAHPGCQLQLSKPLWGLRPQGWTHGPSRQQGYKELLSCSVLFWFVLPVFILGHHCDLSPIRASPTLSSQKIRLAMLVTSSKLWSCRALLSRLNWNNYGVRLKISRKR